MWHLGEKKFFFSGGSEGGLCVYVRRGSAAFHLERIRTISAEKQIKKKQLTNKTKNPQKQKTTKTKQ